MDWVKYYQDQINKSTDYGLNKVEDFTWNQTGGFIRSLGTFLWKQNYALRKWIYPESIKALEEHLERVKEENEEKRKKLLEHKKKMAEIYGSAQKPI